MTRVTNFIYCNSAIGVPSSDGKGFSINANSIFSVLLPEFVPGVYSFSIVFTVLEIDITQSNTIKVILKDDQGRELTNTGDTPLPPQPEVVVSLPEKYLGITMSMDFRNIIFEQEGEYNIQVYINHNLIEENIVYVKGIRSVYGT